MPQREFLYCELWLMQKLMAAHSTRLRDTGVLNSKQDTYSMSSAAQSIVYYR